MALRLPENIQKKLALLSMATDLSQSDLVSLLIAAVDQVQIEEMKTERGLSAAEAPKPRVVRIRRTANWVTKM